jgi:hypothetical protein
MIINALYNAIIQFINILLTKPTLDEPILMGDNISGRVQGSTPGCNLKK